MTCKNANGMTKWKNEKNEMQCNGMEWTYMK